MLEQARADSTQASSETSDLLEIVKQLQSRYADSKLQLDYQIDQVSDLSIKIAPSQLKIILTNLFDNSLHHSADCINISVTAQSDLLRISIHDNGSGVSEANRKRIFTPFFTTRRENGGTGLGLGIVASLLKANKGTISLIDSDSGACFEIVLPKNEKL